MNTNLFTAIASVYDRMNHCLTLGMDGCWRFRLVEDLDGSPGRVVDLATGTGEVALKIARRFPQAEIQALDINAAMLAVARKKPGGGSVSFRLADAGEFSSCITDPVDVITCAFGFRNFPDPGKVLRECRKTLTVGGGLALLEFFRTDRGFLAGCVRIWIRLIALLLSPGQRSSYRYLCDSMRHTYSVSEFVSLAESCGFRRVRRHGYFPCCTHLVFVAV